MALLDLLTRSAEVAGAVDGIVTVYPLPPEAPPPDVNLPAVVAVPIEGDLTGGDSEMHDHTWELAVLVARGADRFAAYGELLPFYEAVVVAFRSQTTLGLPNTYGVRIAHYQTGPVAHLDSSYFGITFTMRGKQKFNATYS